MIALKPESGVLPLVPKHGVSEPKDFPAELTSIYARFYFWSDPLLLFFECLGEIKPAPHLPELDHLVLLGLELLPGRVPHHPGLHVQHPARDLVPEPPVPDVRDVLVFQLDELHVV